MESEQLDERAVRDLPTGDLIRRALEEVQLLVRAEVLHARRELGEEISAAKKSGMLMGAAGALALSGLSVLFVALALALPFSPALGNLIVGLFLVAAAGVLGWQGVKALPKKPLPRTQERLKTDFRIAREQLQ